MYTILIYLVYVRSVHINIGGVSIVLMVCIIIIFSFCSRIMCACMVGVCIAYSGVCIIVLLFYMWGVHGWSVYSSRSVYNHYVFCVCEACAYQNGWSVLSVMRSAYNSCFIFVLWYPSGCILLVRMRIIIRMIQLGPLILPYLLSHELKIQWFFYLT